MAAKEISAWSVQLGDAPPAGEAVHDARADEVGPRSAESARHANNADGLHHVLPFAAANPHAIGEIESVGLGAQRN